MVVGNGCDWDSQDGEHDIRVAGSGPTRAGHHRVTLLCLQKDLKFDELFVFGVVGERQHGDLTGQVCIHEKGVTVPRWAAAKPLFVEDPGSGIPDTQKRAWSQSTDSILQFSRYSLSVF